MPDPVAPPAPVSPSLEAPGGASIQTINAADAKPSGVTVPEGPQAIDAPEPRKLSVKEFLQRKGDTDSKISLERMTPKERTRDPKTGEFVKQPKKKPAQVVKVEKPGTTPATGATPAEPAAEPTLPPPVNKIKVGDREMTEEEVAAHIAKLESAAKAPPAAPPAPEVKKTDEPPAAPEKPAAAEPTPEEIKAREDIFIADQAKHFTPTQEQFDDMLATGNPKLFGEMIAKGLLEARKFMANAVNPIFDRLERNIEPMLTREQQIAQYQAESDFLSVPENKDLATHADQQKMKTILRKVNEDQHAEYALYQQLKATNQPIPSFLQKVANYEGNGWVPYMADAIRKELALSPPPPPAPATPPAAPKPAPRPAPPTGQPIGAGGSTAPVSSQSAVIARIRGKY